MKKFFTVLLTITVFFSVLCGINFAVYAATENGFTYSVKNNEATITDYTGTETDIKIPSTLGGYPVTTIGEYAFELCPLISVEFCKSITTLDSGAFSSCHSLVSVKMYDNVTTIKNDVFFDCFALESVRLSKNLVSIGGSAFESCRKLKNIEIPSSVTSIGQAAFDGCASLQKIEIPDGVYTIQKFTFEYCVSMESLRLPTSITEIKRDAFGDCNGLKYIFFGGSQSDRENIIYGSRNSSLNDAVWHYGLSGHKFKWVIDKKPMCKTSGKKHQECTVTGCNAKAKLDTKISATGEHVSDNGVVTKKATYNSTGIKTYSCTNCDTVVKTVEIKKLTRKSIKKAKVTGVKDKAYTGKNLTQSVKVKLGSKTLSSKTDYTVFYENNKSIGTATLIIKGKGKYGGTITKTFKVTPKKVSAKSFSSAKKKEAKLTWKRDSKASGYEIVYATNSKFKKSKKTTVRTNKITAKTIKKLTSKKTYYVKVRSYKTIKGKKLYGSYSKVLRVKVK